MQVIPIITSNKTLFTKIASCIGDLEEKQILPVWQKSAEAAVEFLNVEMPDLVFINFSDKKIDPYTLLDSILSDPWLHHCGIVVLCEQNEDIKEIELKRGANIIVDLSILDIEENLPKVLSIIRDNRRIIFQRGLSSDLIKNISGSFKINNETLEVKCYVNLICNFLYNANKLDADKKFNLQLAINEMLLNAIEHGNCKISYDEKTQWLAEHGSIEDLIRKRLKDPVIQAKKVTFDYTITSTCAKFFIADEGDGFNWRKLKDTSKMENIFELHGRGIIMTKNVVQNLSYNEKGNEVSFEIAYEPDEAGMTPGLFTNMKARDLNSGDIVFKMGEPSDFLYYIVKGRYNIIVHDKIVSTLTADDIFLGEMSFLLNNKRSATVKAATNGKLIEVSKKDFVDAIKKKPHYALFLSRLLAQRIQRSNECK